MEGLEELECNAGKREDDCNDWSVLQVSDRRVCRNGVCFRLLIGRLGELKCVTVK